MTYAPLVGFPNAECCPKRRRSPADDAANSSGTGILQSFQTASNMQDLGYRAGKDFPRLPIDTRFCGADDGLQGGSNEGLPFYGWAVRAGQVAAAPLPGTALLMALGFGAMAVLRRARRRLW